MGKSAAIKTDREMVSAAMASQLEIEFSGADPKLLALVRLLISENASIRDSINNLRKELHAAHALADRDPLCPVLNRRAFMRELEREIARTERHGRSLSLLFIDLDKFKNINDTQGHEAGDRTLIAMSKTLVKAVRKTDVVSRIGGDEFGILLIETNNENAKSCAEALKSRIAKDNIGVTASIGAASWHSGVTADELMAKADKKMFTQKAKAALAR